MARMTTEDALKWLEKATIHDPARPVLTYAYSGEEYTAASDGYRAHIVWPRLLDDGTWISFKHSAEADKLGREPRFPDVSAVIPKHWDYELLFNTSQLRHAMSSIERFVHAAKGSWLGGAWCWISFDPEGKRVVLTARAEGHDIQMVLAAQMRGVFPTDPVSVNTGYWADALSGFDSFYVTVTQQGEHYPFTFGEIGDRLALVMPAVTERKTPSITLPDIEPRPLEYEFQRGTAVATRPIKKPKPQVVRTFDGQVHEVRFEVWPASPRYCAEAALVLLKSGG